MNSYLLYIGDSLVDLWPDSNIATTIQRADFGDISFRKVNRTNSIKVPRTENNDLIFGHASNEKSNSVNPYLLNSVNLKVNGQDMFMDGYCYVIECDNKEYSIAIVENIYNVFTFIKGRDISYLNPIETSSWTAAGRDAARLNTSGIVTAVLNWGRGIYLTDYFLPSFYYHSIVTPILQSTGLTLSGSILTHTDFTDLVIPFCGDKFEYNDVFEDLMYTKVEAGTIVRPVLLEPFVSGDRVRFDAYTSANQQFWDFSLYEFENTTVYDLPIDVSVIVNVYNITYDTSNPANALVVDVIHESGGIQTSLGTDFVIYPNTTGTITITPPTSVTVLPGDKLYCLWDNYGDVGGINNAEVDTEFETSFNKVVSIPNTIWNLLWPKITLENIISDFNNRFGIFYKQIGNVLYLKTLQEICTDTGNAVDWTNKRVNVESKKVVLAGGYARENYFEYTDQVENPILGRGVIDISDNTSRDIQKTLFSSPFGNCITEPTSSYLVCTIPAYDADSASLLDIVDSSLRIATLKERTSETAITFDATPRTDFKLAYFMDSTKTKDTGFQYFINNYYGAFSDALQRQKVCTFEYYLDEFDIANYDPFKMIYDSGSHYIVNKIVNFIPGKVTKVELFKVL